APRHYGCSPRSLPPPSPPTIYTLSLHDALPISSVPPEMNADFGVAEYLGPFKWLFYQKLVLSNTATAAARLLGANPQKIYWHHRSEEHTSELQSRFDLVCRLLLETKKRARRQYS